MEFSNPTYEYQVSLRVTHPVLTPDSFTAALNLDPKTSWSVGDPCKDRHGSLASGKREESHWLHSFEEKKDGDLPSFLSHVTSRLAAHQDFFHKISSSGGRAELLVGFFIDAPNSSIPLTPGLLGRCSELGLHIYIDIYS